MNDGEIYNLLERIDNGYDATEDEIFELSNVEEIRWNGMLFSHIPQSIKILDSLRKLDISQNSSLIDISGLTSLKNLRSLNISNLKLVIDFSPISEMKELQTLDISDNRFFYDLTVLSKLVSLVNLNISYNLYVHNISVLSGLVNLKFLDLSKTSINDISILSQFKKLEAVYLKDTYINDISVLDGLTNLRIIDLRNLKIPSIPEGILRSKLDFIYDKSPSGSGIYIWGLTLTEQSKEIFRQSRELIREYYIAYEKIPVNECKVIFLGDAESGKTLSIKRLLDKGAYQKDFKGNSTPGIEITISSTIFEDSNIAVNYWDFGGQEIQHSMHRMFLTERTVYVVFLNARQDPLDERARYWLENIRSFAPHAPVLMVINKIDQNDRPKFNEEGIRNTYNQIRNVIRMSALKDSPEEFLNKLQGNINNIMKNMESVKAPIPKAWKMLMDEIRTMPEPYLTTEQFKEKCIVARINNYRTIHDELVELFQDIGVSFCYYKNRLTADYMLLNPKWLVNALYTIIVNSEQITSNGVITQSDLYNVLKEDMINGKPVRRVIPDLRYGGIEVNYILGVIRMFRLSYSMKDGAEFFPMLCDGNEKISVHQLISENSLHYIFRYKYLPANIMHRLIVEMQRDLDYRYVWYSGAVFRESSLGQIAYTCTKGNDLHIYVESNDGFYNPNEYLTPILNDVRAINKEMGVDADEYITYKINEVETELLFEEVKSNLEYGIYTSFNMKIGKVIDYRNVVHRYIDRRPKIEGMLLQDIIKALGAMQNDITYYKNDKNSKNLENSRNRYVSQQLRMAGHICSDQQTGGESPGGRNPGERDIVFLNSDGEEYLIYEGLNLNSANTKDIYDHLKKLIENYNPRGLQYGVLVTYLGCFRSKFQKVINDYLKCITETSPETFKCIGKPEIIPTVGQFIKCIEMNYECGSIYFTIYHIIVRVAPN